MRGGWGGAGNLQAPPESIQETGSLQQPVAQCVLCRLDRRVYTVFSSLGSFQDQKLNPPEVSRLTNHLILHDMMDMFFCCTELHKWDVFSSGHAPRLTPGTWSSFPAFSGRRPKVKSQELQASQQATNQKVPKVLIALSHT